MNMEQKNQGANATSMGSVNTNLIQERWNNNAEKMDYYGNYEAKEILTDICQKILRIMADKGINKETCKVLDIGGGVGTFSDVIKSLKPSWDFTIMEYAEALALKAKDFGFKSITGDLNNLVIKEKYDLIICKHCFHYSKDFEKTYKDIHEALNEKGVFLIISTRGKETIYPFPKDLQEQYTRLSYYTEEYFGKSVDHLFDQEGLLLNYRTSFSKKFFMELVLGRFLCFLTDEVGKKMEEHQKTLPDTLKIILKYMLIMNFKLSSS